MTKKDTRVVRGLRGSGGGGGGFYGDELLQLLDPKRPLTSKISFGVKQKQPQRQYQGQRLRLKQHERPPKPYEEHAAHHQDHLHQQQQQRQQQQQQQQQRQQHHHRDPPKKAFAQSESPKRPPQRIKWNVKPSDRMTSFETQVKGQTFSSAIFPTRKEGSKNRGQIHSKIPKGQNYSNKVEKVQNYSKAKAEDQRRVEQLKVAESKISQLIVEHQRMQLLQLQQLQRLIAKHDQTKRKLLQAAAKAAEAARAAKAAKAAKVAAIAAKVAAKTEDEKLAAAKNAAGLKTLSNEHKLEKMMVTASKPVLEKTEILPNGEVHNHYYIDREEEHTWSESHHHQRHEDTHDYTVDGKLIDPITGKFLLPQPVVNDDNDPKLQNMKISTKAHPWVTSFDKIMGENHDDGHYQRPKEESKKRRRDHDDKFKLQKRRQLSFERDLLNFKAEIHSLLDKFVAYVDAIEPPKVTKVPVFIQVPVQVPIKVPIFDIPMEVARDEVVRHEVASSSSPPIEIPRSEVVVEKVAVTKMSPTSRSGEASIPSPHAHFAFADENDTAIRTFILPNGTIHHFYPKIIFDRRHWE